MNFKNYLVLVLMLFGSTLLRSQESDSLSYSEKLNSGDNLKLVVYLNAVFPKVI